MLNSKLLHRDTAIEIQKNMPDHEEHCRHSEQRYGVRGDDIHWWIDELSGPLGSSHREFRHNAYRDLPMVYRIFGQKYGNDIAREIFLDHITLDVKERASNQTPKEEPSPTYASSTYYPSGSNWDLYLFIALVAIVAFIGAYNTAFGNSIGLWCAENLYRIVGFSIFAIILGILFLIIWNKTKK